MWLTLNSRSKLSKKWIQKNEKGDPDPIRTCFGSATVKSIQYRKHFYFFYGFTIYISSCSFLHHVVSQFISLYCVLPNCTEYSIKYYIYIYICTEYSIQYYICMYEYNISSFSHLSFFCSCSPLYCNIIYYIFSLSLLNYSIST